MVKKKLESLSISGKGVGFDSTVTSSGMIPLLSVDENGKKQDIGSEVEDLNSVLNEVIFKNGDTFQIVKNGGFPEGIMKNEKSSKVEKRLHLAEGEIRLNGKNLGVKETLKEKYQKLLKLHKQKSFHRSILRKNILFNRKDKNGLIKSKNASTSSVLNSNMQFKSVSYKLCKKGFKITEDDNNHKNKKSSKNDIQEKYKCTVCSIVFKYKNYFDRHVKGHYRNNCKICAAKFAKRKALCKHLKEVHAINEPEKLYCCKFCEKTFSKRQSLHTHLKNHADGKSLCLKCGFMTADEAEFTNHRKAHIDNSKYACLLCDKRFMRRQQHNQHMMGHKRHSCSHCSSTFSTKKLLQKHQQSSHGIIVAKIHECPICKKTFERLFYLKLHSRKHTGERPFKCLQCETNFTCKKSLDMHLKTATHLQNMNSGKKIQVEKPFLCSFCGATFFRQQSLSRHVEIIHTPGEPLKCPHCEYSTKCKANFKRHAELHSDIKRYVCEICGISFRALATLKEHHAFVHSERRSFTCDTCNKSFKNKSSLQRHLRIHRDDRPFKCHCDRAYKRRSHLKRHMAAAHQMSMQKSFDCKNMEVNELGTSSNSSTSKELSLLVGTQQSVLSQNSSSKNQHFCVDRFLEQNVSQNISGESLSPKNSQTASGYSYRLYTNVEDFLNKTEFETPVKNPLQSITPLPATPDDGTLSVVSLNSFSQNFSELSRLMNLADNGLSTAMIETGSSEMQLQANQDMNSLRPRSLPNLNFQASSDDSLFPFLMRNSELSPIPQFLLNTSELPSHSLDQNASKQLFETNDILSNYDKPNELGASPKLSDVWSINHHTTLKDVTKDSPNKNMPALQDLINGPSSFLASCNLMFPNDPLLECTIDHDPFNTEDFVMP